MPRKITNNSNLPAPMFNALSAETYVGGGDISITRLIAPPRQRVLRKFNEEEIEEDAAARIWSLNGQSIHRVLELAASHDVIVETRLFMPIEGLHLSDGPWVWKLSGQPDVYEPAKLTISDYKVTSIWSVLNGGKDEWDAQLNLQAMLHRHKGDKVEHAQIVAIMRDWQVAKSRVEKDYPPHAVKVINIPVWTAEKTKDYATFRVRLHQQAEIDYLESGRDCDALPLCTPEERWYRGHKFAVKKQDKTGKVNKKADRLFDNMEGAIEYMQQEQMNLPKGKFYAPVEERPGINRRCEDYCDVRHFCTFYQNLMKEKAKAPAELQFSADDSEATE